MKKKPLVAFVCTHNSCRSQMAEALAKLQYSDVFDSCSAGTEIRNRINPDAVQLIRERYGVDMEKNGQFNKRITDIPSPDILVTMGCGVSCPAVKAQWKEDWGLDDPTGKGMAAFAATLDIIEKKMRELAEKILQTR
ncbi:MAG: arsenate reductase ArsC [Treponema sp.]|nr:arsenate reductase ArsC [Treponema sp.]